MNPRRRIQSRMSSFPKTNQMGCRCTYKSRLQMLVLPTSENSRVKLQGLFSSLLFLSDEFHVINQSNLTTRLSNRATLVKPIRMTTCGYGILVPSTVWTHKASHLC